MEQKLSLLKLITTLAIIITQVSAVVDFGSDFDAPVSNQRISKIKGRVSKCVDDPSNHFFLKTNKNDANIGIFQTCDWLKHRHGKKEICESVASWADGTGPAKEECPNTCGRPCNSGVPSAAPSNIPTSSPTAAPILCEENSEALFFLRTSKADASIPIYQSCAWLKGRSTKDDICDSVESWGSGSTATGPAREVCLNTCKTCTPLLPDDYPTIGDRGAVPDSLVDSSDGSYLPTLTASIVVSMAMIAVFL